MTKDKAEFEHVRQRMDEYMKSLQDKLLYIIGAEEYTLQEMADICGISKRKLCEIICGEQKGISFSTLVKIAEHLDLPISVLIGEKAEHGR